jgi:hypothetical protein
MRHTVSGQSYRRKVMRAQRALLHGNFGYKNILKVESINFVMITYRSASLFHDLSSPNTIWKQFAFDCWHDVISSLICKRSKCKSERVLEPGHALDELWVSSWCLCSGIDERSS